MGSLSRRSAFPGRSLGVRVALQPMAENTCREHEQIEIRSQYKAGGIGNWLRSRCLAVGFSRLGSWWGFRGSKWKKTTVDPFVAYSRTGKRVNRVLSGLNMGTPSGLMAGRPARKNRRVEGLRSTKETEAVAEYRSIGKRHGAYN